MWLSILLLAVIGLLLLITKLVNSMASTETAGASRRAKPETIHRLPPGPKPTDSQHGNRPDIVAAGSLHEYLVPLHEKYGDIVSFHIDQELYISISSRELFTQHSKLTSRVPNRPPQIIENFLPVCGIESLAFAQDDEWSVHRQRYDQFFTADAVAVYYTVFQQIADETVQKFSHLPPEEHIPLADNMLTIAVQSLARSLYATTFDIHKYLSHYRPLWKELERRLVGDPPPDNSPEQKQFDQDIASMWETIREVIRQRRQNGPEDNRELLIDSILNNAETEKEVDSEVLNFLVAGQHTSAYLMTWVIYLLASRPDIQEKAVKELNDVLGEDNVLPSNLPLLQYMRQIQDETMRWSNLISFGGRHSKDDITLGGYHVPGKTPVVHAIGVMNRDTDLWPEPTKFDPDRFSPEKVKAFPPFAFEPFGVGKRKCIGHRVAYAETAVVLATLLRKFRFKLVEGQNDVVVHGFVTRPRDEVWVTIEKRQ